MSHNLLKIMKNDIMLNFACNFNKLRVSLFYCNHVNN